MVDTTRVDINLQLFEWLFPQKYVEDVIHVKTNKVLDQQPVTYGELLHWIGLWVLISTFDGSDHPSFGSSKLVNMYEGAPFQLGEYIVRTGPPVGVGIGSLPMTPNENGEIGVLCVESVLAGTGRHNKT